MTSLPPYAVPGIEPSSGTPGHGSVAYSGDGLAGLPSVAATLDRFPAELIGLTHPDDERDEFPITRTALAEQVHVSTGDGLRWLLGFDDEIGDLVQPRLARNPEDYLEQALAAQPDVESAYHYDRESFEATTTRVIRADEMLARWLDAILVAHQAYARHLGRDLPY